MMNRRMFAKALAAPGATALQTLAAPYQEAERRSRPNVVILLADDLGWADVGFHNSEIRTPNLDRLAAGGLQLDRFYSCPLCSPTRSALMTGRNPIRLGTGYTVVRPWVDYGIPLREHFLPQTFHAAGYQTAMAGKWHLGHARRAWLPGARGFDSSYGHFNGAVDYFSHEREGGLDWHRDGKALREAGYTTDLIGREAEARITRRDPGRPFLLYVPFNAPHTPLQAPEDLIDKYRTITDAKRRTFAAMVDSMDRAVGRILDALEQERVLRDTIVLFFSDNGGPVGSGARNTPLRGAKGSTWEGGIRVPAILSWPGTIKAGVSKQFMTAADVFPTLAAGAGLKPGNTQPLDGKNLWTELSERKTVARENLFFSVESRQGLVNYALIDGPWKLMVEQVDGQEKSRLYRIADDPFEMEDLSSSEPKITAQLRERMNAWLALHPADGLRHLETRPPQGWKAPAEWASAAR